MNRKILFLLFCFISVLSVHSGGKKDRQDKDPNDLGILNPPQKVESISISNERLTVNGERDDIAFSLNTDKYINDLEKADTYTHAVIQRPDGPIDMMELMQGDDLICWVGDGVRANMGPSGLKVFPDEGVDKILVQADGKKWDVVLKKETPIIWNDQEYIVFVSKIKKGTMQDQPEFSVDLVIMRK